MGNNPHPLMRMYREGELEEELSSLSEQVFGFPLTLDRVNGDVQLRVGSPGVSVPPLNRPTHEYSDSVAHLSTLESQGDGVKSFIGLALYVLAGQQQIILIDEPEAFLHQSQAKSLGRWLSHTSKETSRQVVLATHDRDIVLGLLAGDADVSVLRLTREGNTSQVHQLTAEQLSTVWNDAILRYSNILDGLFYATVVICEGDADCRFYAAVLDELIADGKSTARLDDVLFVPSGGKERIPNIARSLMALQVKTFAIVDFDGLRDRTKLRETVESVGGSWSKIETLYADILPVMNQNHGAAWDQAKHQGLTAFPPGESSRTAHLLLSALRQERVLVVPVGEMEDLDRTVDPKSSKWVNAMLAKEGHRTCAEARELIKAID
jgi:hypothetical protein